MSTIRKILPAGIVDHYRAMREKKRMHALRVAFYQSFLSEGDLVFDIGANVGERVAALLAAGCRVVAVEPQDKCCVLIRSLAANPGSLTVVPKACGAKAGTAELKSGGGTDVLATISEEYISTVAKSGRFGAHKWEATRTVPVCTAEDLVVEFGTPRFIKIDVEGFEVPVLEGLSTAPQILSFEFTPEMTAAMLACIDHCERLGLSEFNISYGESMRFARAEWVNANGMRDVVKILAGDSSLFGDIFARKRRSHLK
jgi:FkbM family methyltransferase